MQQRWHAFGDGSVESLGDSVVLGGVMYGEFCFRTCMIGQCAAQYSPPRSECSFSIFLPC